MLTCDRWPGCGCGTQSGPHTCEGDREKLFAPRVHGESWPGMHPESNELLAGNFAPRVEDGDSDRLLDAMKREHGEAGRPDLAFPVGAFTAAQKRECIGREIKLRKRVYQRRVEEGKMTAQQATREISLMLEIEDDYRQVEQKEKLL